MYETIMIGKRHRLSLGNNSILIEHIDGSKWKTNFCIWRNDLPEFKKAIRLLESQSIDKIKSSEVIQMSKIQQAKKLMNDLNKLDAQYLTGYPKNIPRNMYVKKRNDLRRRFEALK